MEAASLEGATKTQVYLRILIPQISGHIFTVAILLAMFMLKSFEYIYPLTGGGPGYSSTLFPVLIYRTMFMSFDFSVGAALATFLFALVAIIAIPYILHTRREERRV